MKTALLLILTAGALVCLFGCKTATDPQTCEKAKAAYDAYQLSLLYREPSEDEIKAAKIAAAYLAMRCGWTQQVALHDGRDSAVDANGVPIIAP